jgi:A/G-specific adenine glycosylase
MKIARPPVPDCGIPDIRQLNHPPSIPEFRNIVLNHYRDHGRDLAWRRTTDPYRILVSEIMLQQTQVERVTVKYPAFIDEFPDFPSLARSPLTDILTLWQGMGYNRRAISLQNCARRVVKEYDGILPQDPGVLATFPGIGRATAASICAFAFNMPVVFIETNIRRVFIHFFFSDDEPVHDTDILPLVASSLYQKNPRIWYWALMDLGSALKKTIPNPNRRSTQYVRQSSFEGSDREIRGRIIKTLLTSPDQDIEELIRSIGGERDRVLRILSTLEREGFLTVTGSVIAIRSR